MTTKTIIIIATIIILKDSNITGKNATHKVKVVLHGEVSLLCACCSKLMQIV